MKSQPFKSYFYRRSGPEIARRASCLLLLVLCLLSCLGAALPACAADLTALQALLKHEIIGTNLPLEEVQAYTESRVPLMPAVKNVAEWEQLANCMRRDALEKVVLRGQAAEWRKGKVKVVWQETIEGGPGY